jgi:hypothetical protein
MAKDKKAPEPMAPRPIYVEFPDQEAAAGQADSNQADKNQADKNQAAASVNLEDWQEHSEKAIQQVVASLQEIARQVVAGMDELPEEARPAEMNLWFGIDSHAEAGAVVAFNPKKATFSARMVWYQKEKPAVSLRQTPGLIPPAPANSEDDED